MSSVQGTPSLPKLQTLMDSAPLKSEVGKVHNQNQIKATNMQFSQESTRQAIDIRPPGEEKAQFTDNYNPASTILRGQETDKRESGDQALRDNKDRHGKDKDRKSKGFKHSMNPIQFAFPISTATLIKQRFETLGLMNEAIEAIIDKLDKENDEESLNKLLKGISNSSKTQISEFLKQFLEKGF